MILQNQITLKSSLSQYKNYRDLPMIFQNIIHFHDFSKPENIIPYFFECGKPYNISAVRSG